MCYHVVIIGLSFATVPKTEFHVFGKKAFRIFRGCNREQCKLKHVPFLGILVFRKSLLPFLGDAIKPCFGGKMGLMHVPKSGFLVFRKKLLPKLGHKTAQNGPKRPKTAQNGMRMSLFWTFLFSEKDFCPNKDMQYYVHFS
jgi:hypothetical protein